MDLSQRKNGTLFLAALLVAGGVLSTGSACVLAYKLLQVHWVYLFIAAALLALSLWTIVTGVLLWRSDPRGWKWSIILFASQVPILKVPGLRYEWYSGVNIRLVGGHVTNPLTFEFGSGMEFYLDTRIHDIVYGVNIFALLSLAYLLLVYPNWSFKRTREKPRAA